MTSDVSEDDDEFFCPRLRWAKENNEDLGMIMMHKRFHEAILETLKYIEENPGQTSNDICMGINMPLEKLYQHLSALKLRNVVMFSERDKYGLPPRYWVKSRPKKLPFIYRKESFSS